MRDSGPDTDQEAKARRQAQLEQVDKYCVRAIKLTTLDLIDFAVIAVKAQ